MELDDFKRKPRLKVDNSEEAAKARMRDRLDRPTSHEKAKKKLFTIVIINLFLLQFIYLYDLRKGVEARLFHSGIGFCSSTLSG